MKTFRHSWLKRVLAAEVDLGQRDDGTSCGRYKQVRAHSTGRGSGDRKGTGDHLHTLPTDASWMHMTLQTLLGNCAGRA